jgi:hypothetical protein
MSHDTIVADYPEYSLAHLAYRCVQWNNEMNAIIQSNPGILLFNESFMMCDGVIKSKQQPPLTKPNKYDKCIYEPIDGSWYVFMELCRLKDRNPIDPCIVKHYDGMYLYHHIEVNHVDVFKHDFDIRYLETINSHYPNFSLEKELDKLRKIATIRNRYSIFDPYIDALKDEVITIRYHDNTIELMLKSIIFPRAPWMRRIANTLVVDEMNKIDYLTLVIKIWNGTDVGHSFSYSEYMSGVPLSTVLNYG